MAGGRWTGAERIFFRDRPGGTQDRTPLSPGTRETIRAMRQADDYAYKRRPRILHPADGPIKGAE